MINLYSEGRIKIFKIKEENSDLMKYRNDLIYGIKNFVKLMDNYELTSSFQQITTLIETSNRTITKLAP
jgi:hypothetical protein